MAGEARVVDMLDRRMRGQYVNDGLGILVVGRHAGVKRPQTTQGQVAVKGRSCQP